MDAKIAILVALLVAAVVAEDKPAAEHAPKRTECTTPDTWVAKLDGIDVENCPPGELCLLEKGTEKEITMEFTPSEELGAIRARVHGIISNHPMVYQVPEPDACKNSNLVCPVSAGEASKYVARLPVKSFYPQIRLPVMWELINEQNEVIVCAMIPVKIVKAGGARA